MAAMLERLIEELFDLVLGLLSLSDLSSLRLASHLLEQRSRMAFGAIAFSEISTDFTPANLEWLSNVASTEHRFAVRSLVVRDRARRGIQNWYGYTVFAYGHGAHWPRLRNKRRQIATVDPSSEHAKQFVDAISRFPNCDTATVTETMKKQRPPVTNRKKPPFTEALSSADAVELVLCAYSAPGAPPIRCFRVRCDTCVDWFAWPMALSETTTTLARVAFAAHVTELVLHSAAAGYDGEARDGYVPHILGLLTAATNVRTLRLVWGGARHQKKSLFDLSSGNYDGSWNYEVGVSYQNPLGPHLDAFPGFAPPLENLTLGHMALSQDHLLKFLAMCQSTLADLRMYNVHLVPGSWKKVLGFLRGGTFPKLRRIAIHGAVYGTIHGAIYGKDLTYLTFCPLWGARGEIQTTYGGGFEFGTISMSSTSPEAHILGVVFEAKLGAPSMEAGLGIMVEYSRREAKGLNWKDPCEEAGPVAEQLLQPLKEPAAAYKGYESFTGLSAIVMPP